MERYYGCDAHKAYSVFTWVNEKGSPGPAFRVENDRLKMRCFLRQLPERSPIAVESVGNWYWLVEEMEQAGHRPLLTNPGKAKVMMGQINKTDKLDARGLAVLLRNGTLPKVWIPPGELRDLRELPRMRMALVRMRTMLKNRIHATWAKYAIYFNKISDIFGVSGREVMRRRLEELPPQTRHSVEIQLELLDPLEKQIRECEERMKELIRQTPEMELLMSLPGVGLILAMVILLEVGEVDRFPTAGHLACYAGTLPRVKESGGKRSYGRIRPDVNHNLRWAFIEAANVVVMNQERWADRHVVQLYRRLRQRKGHGKATVAVARHLAEATYWMLKKGEPYRPPRKRNTVSSTQG